jgi:hypothetical protein
VLAYTPIHSSLSACLSDWAPKVSKDLDELKLIRAIARVEEYGMSLKDSDRRGELKETKVFLKRKLQGICSFRMDGLSLRPCFAPYQLGSLGQLSNPLKFSFIICKTKMVTAYFCGVVVVVNDRTI